MQLPNVGKSLAEKIAEIAESGSLAKLEVKLKQKQYYLILVQIK